MILDWSLVIGVFQDQFEMIRISPMARSCHFDDDDETMSSFVFNTCENNYKLTFLSIKLFFS